METVNEESFTVLNTEQFMEYKKLCYINRTTL